MKTTVYIAAIFLLTCQGCTEKKGLLPQQAPQTAAVSGCDSLQVSYAKNVMPVLQSNCYACHSTSITTNTGGLDLEDFTSLKSYLNNQFHQDGVYGSKFMHIIRQSQGVIPMPPVGKMSDCEIGIINKWVSDGAPNN